MTRENYDTPELPQMIQKLFGEAPTSSLLQSYLKDLASSDEIGLSEPEIKAYPDVTYFNYYTLGISLLFVPRKGRTSTEPSLKHAELSLDGIDIYNTNTVKDAGRSKGKTYSPFPRLPMKLPSGAVEGDALPPQIELTGETTGRDFVRSLGEPSRKGGGAGPSTGSISIWCEWSKLGIMVEFGGDEARGPQAWDRGKDAVWKVVSLFPPKES